MPADKKKAKKKGKDQEDEGPTIGVKMFPNGDKYEGEFTSNADNTAERKGLGTHKSADGMVYTGSWAEDKMNGTGCIEFPTGAKYEGEFVNNKFQGHGRYTWPNGSFYDGQFNENKMEGTGEFTDTDGQVWTGTFRYKAAPGLRFKVNLEI